MKYLIVGLGNPGSEYEYTRHNIGFRILDALAKASNIVFEDKRYGWRAEMRVKNKTLILLKPSTFMNLSGNAVRYWMNKEKIELDNLLVVVDDLSLDFTSLRIRGKGSDAGHNGLRHIQDILGTSKYARLRYGIGNDFFRGMQVDYVMSKFLGEEEQQIADKMPLCHDMIKSFCLAGLQTTMNDYNNK